MTLMSEEVVRCHRGVFGGFQGGFCTSDNGLSCSSTSYSEEEAGWDTEIKDDVIEECNKHGGVIHIYVDKNSAQVCLIPRRSLKQQL